MKAAMVENPDSPTSTTPPPQKRKKPLWRRILQIALSIFAVWVVFQLSCGTSGQFDFYLRSVPLISLVRQAKSARLPVGTDARFRADSLLYPRSLKLEPMNLANWTNNFKGTLTVHHDKAGWYAISIVTFDMGHLGRSGYIYSEEPLDSGDEPIATFGDLSSIHGRVGEHWWATHSEGM
jgi:hypothetical protein